MSFENMQDNSNNRIAKEFSDFFTVKLSFFQYFPIVYFFLHFLLPHPFFLSPQQTTSGISRNISSSALPIRAFTKITNI